MATKTKNKKYEGGIYDPGAVLRAAALKKAAQSAANIEYKPVINAHKRELEQIAKQRARDQRGLAKLGQKTNKTISQAYAGTSGALKSGIGTADNIGQDIIDQTAENTDGARMRGVQEQALGGMLSSLATADVPTGQSESQNALSEAIAARAADDAGNDEAYRNIASMTAAGMSDTARNRLAANQMAKSQALTASTSAVASRRMASREGYADQQAEVRGGLSDARSLKGATVLQNIMKLRDSERGFVNERAALNLDAQKAAEEARSNRADEANDAKDNGSGSGSGSGDGEFDPTDPLDRPNKLAPFWDEWRRKADQARNGGPIEPGFWNKFLDGLEENKDVEWSAKQRDEFLKKYKQYVKNKG